MTLTAKREEPRQLKVDNLDVAANMVITACGGDVRDAIRALVVANSFMLEEVERYRSLVSPGYMRGKLSLYDLP